MIRNKSYLKCKKIETAIRRARKLLIEEAEKNGVYENFGQSEIRNIKDKFIDISNYTEEMNSRRRKLDNFYEWCIRYTGV